MTQKVLVVDDDTSLSSRLRVYLISLGYEVDIDKSGSDAHATLVYEKPGQFCAVVSDMRMPNGSGLWLCQALDGEDAMPPMLIHSTDSEYYGDGVHIENLDKLKEYFDFVKAVHLKPEFSNDFVYVKEFLNGIQ